MRHIMEIWHFIGAESRELMFELMFRGELNPTELTALHPFVLIAQNTFGNHRAEKYAHLVNNMLTPYKRISLQKTSCIHISFVLPLNLGAISNNRRFNQYISEMETGHQSWFNPCIMGDYCWFLQRQSRRTHKRKSKNLKLF